jgi:TPR repeat protein
MNLARAGDKASLNKGEQFLDASCKVGDGAACNRIGRIGLSQVSGATTTLGEGLYYLRRGCDFDFGPACTYLSVAYSGGMKVNPDNAVALALLEKGCRLGDAEGCSMAMSLLASDPGARGGMPRIDPAAPVAEQLRLAKAAAEGSGDRWTGVNAVVRLMQEENEDAAWLLGGWLYYGLDGVFDTSRRADGLILFENAAKVGHVDAAIFMGMAYWFGDGVAEDRPKGENFMAIAATRGSKMAGAIYRSMKLEPVRQENARRQKEYEEWAASRKNDWSSSFANWAANFSMASSSSYSSPSSSTSVSSIIDNGNWNQRINYLSGYTSACPSSNPYC